MTGVRGEVYDYVEEGDDFSGWAGVFCTNRKIAHKLMADKFKEYFISIGKPDGKIIKPKKKD